MKGYEHFTERWWHFGIHWPCMTRFSDWFVWERGRYCYPCWDRARRVDSVRLRSGLPHETGDKNG